MTQLYKNTIDGVNVTTKDAGCTISLETNRMYDVATFIIGDTDNVILKKDVVINAGDTTFTGFVYAVSRTGKNALRVECRTYSAKLTEPYSPHETAVDEASTSHTLCTLYSTISGIPITITTADLSFGGSYERTGTMLSALTNIAAVTGAEYYDNNGTLIIAPNKAIEIDGLEIPDSDIFDFVPSSQTIYNKGVGFVTVRNGGSETSDIISKNNIYVEIDECTGEAFIFPNPYGEIEYVKGITTPSPMLIDRKESKGVLDEDIVYLDGAISSIYSITLNGIAITNYNFSIGHNVLYFTTKLRGTIDVSYMASAYKGYATSKVTPLGRFITFDMFYLDQVLKFQGFLSAKCGGSATDGDMTCIVDGDLVYPRGFSVYTIGGVPSLSLFNRDTKINRTIVTRNVSYTVVEDATLEPTATGYRYKVRHPVTNDVAARSAGVAISYTTLVEGDDYYFVFSSYHPLITVAYKTAAKRHYIKFANIVDGLITLAVINDNTGEVCEYELDGIDEDNSDLIPCSLPAVVPIDIPSELGVIPDDAIGKVITFVKPSGTSGSATVDEFGIIKINVTIDGDYVLDTSYIKPRTTITLTSQVNG